MRVLEHFSCQQHVICLGGGCVSQVPPTGNSLRITHHTHQGSHVCLSPLLSRGGTIHCRRGWYQVWLSCAIVKHVSETMRSAGAVVWQTSIHNRSLSCMSRLCSLCLHCAKCTFVFHTMRSLCSVCFMCCFRCVLCVLTRRSGGGERLVELDDVYACSSRLRLRPEDHLSHGTR